MIHLCYFLPIYFYQVDSTLDCLDINKLVRYLLVRYLLVRYLLAIYLHTVLISADLAHRSLPVMTMVCSTSLCSTAAQSKLFSVYTNSRHNSEIVKDFRL